MYRFSFLLAFVTTLHAIDMDPSISSLLPMEDAQQLVIQNRILAKVDDKVISVIDVMKKMDLFLQRYYPHLIHSTAARYQYYSSQWRDTLEQMIDQELILQDATHLELKVSDAEVRETILERFGPNLMEALDQIGLTYEEARQMIYTEMVVQRMMWYRVNSKALNRIGPKEIKDAYFEYCQENPPLEEWKYQVLSLRSADQAMSAALARRAADLLHTAALNLSVVLERLREEESDAVAITLSPELFANEKSIAESHKQVLRTLQPGGCSAPVTQTSRVDNSVVQRIFYLKDHTVKTPPSFEQMADKIKDGLLQAAADQENTQYIQRLHARLGHDEYLMLDALPADFQPFTMR